MKLSHQKQLVPASGLSSYATRKITAGMKSFREGSEKAIHFSYSLAKNIIGGSTKDTGHGKFEPVVYIPFQKQYMNSTSFKMMLYTVITAAFGTEHRPSNVPLSRGIVSEQH